MSTPLKYPVEDLKDYLLKNPNATAKDIAVAFSGKITGAKTALYRHKIKLSTILGRMRPLKCSREKLETYLSAHPDATALDASKALNTSRSNVYSFARRYGIKFVRKYQRSRESSPYFRNNNLP